MADDTFIPLTGWQVGWSDANGLVALIVTTPQGLTGQFFLSPEMARDLGENLAQMGWAKTPPEAAKLIRPNTA